VRCQLPVSVHMVWQVQLRAASHHPWCGRCNSEPPTLAKGFAPAQLISAVEPPTLAKGFASAAHIGR